MDRIAKEKAYPRPEDRAGARSCRSLVFKFRQTGDYVVEVAAADFSELVVAGQEQPDPDAAFMAEWAQRWIRGKHPTG